MSLDLRNSINDSKKRLSWLVRQVRQLDPFEATSDAAVKSASYADITARRAGAAPPTGSTQPGAQSSQQQQPVQERIHQHLGEIYEENTTTRIASRRQTEQEVKEAPAADLAACQPDSPALLQQKNKDDAREHHVVESRIEEETRLSPMATAPSGCGPSYADVLRGQQAQQQSGLEEPRPPVLQVRTPCAVRKEEDEEEPRVEEEKDVAAEHSEREHVEPVTFVEIENTAAPSSPQDAEAPSKGETYAQVLLRGARRLLHPAHNKALITRSSENLERKGGFFGSQVLERKDVHRSSPMLAPRADRSYERSVSPFTKRVGRAKFEQKDNDASKQWKSTEALRKERSISPFTRVVYKGRLHKNNFEEKWKSTEVLSVAKSCDKDVEEVHKPEKADVSESSTLEKKFEHNLGAVQKPEPNAKARKKLKKSKIEDKPSLIPAPVFVATPVESEPAKTREEPAKEIIGTDDSQSKSAIPVPTKRTKQKAKLKKAKSEENASVSQHQVTVSITQSEHLEESMPSEGPIPTFLVGEESAVPQEYETALSSLSVLTPQEDKGASSTVDTDPNHISTRIITHSNLYINDEKKTYYSIETEVIHKTYDLANPLQTSEDATSQSVAIEQPFENKTEPEQTLEEILTESSENVPLQLLLQLESASIEKIPPALKAEETPALLISHCPRLSEISNESEVLNELGQGEQTAVPENVTVTTEAELASAKSTQSKDQIQNLPQISNPETLSGQVLEIYPEKVTEEFLEVKFELETPTVETTVVSEVEQTAALPFEIITVEKTTLDTTFVEAPVLETTIASQFEQTAVLPMDNTQVEPSTIIPTNVEAPVLETTVVSGLEQTMILPVEKIEHEQITLKTTSVEAPVLETTVVSGLEQTAELPLESIVEEGKATVIQTYVDAPVVTTIIPELDQTVDIPLEIIATDQITLSPTHVEAPILETTIVSKLEQITELTLENIEVEQSTLTLTPVETPSVETTIVSELEQTVDIPLESIATEQITLDPSHIEAPVLETTVVSGLEQAIILPLQNIGQEQITLETTSVETLVLETTVISGLEQTAELPSESMEAKQATIIPTHVDAPVVDTAITSELHQNVDLPSEVNATEQITLSPTHVEAPVLETTIVSKLEQITESTLENAEVEQSTLTLTPVETPSVETTIVSQFEQTVVLPMEKSAVEKITLVPILVEQPTEDEINIQVVFSDQNKDGKQVALEQECHIEEKSSFSDSTAQQAPDSLKTQDEEKASALTIPLFKDVEEKPQRADGKPATHLAQENDSNLEREITAENEQQPEEGEKIEVHEMEKLQSITSDGIKSPENLQSFEVCNPKSETVDTRHTSGIKKLESVTSKSKEDTKEQSELTSIHHSAGKTVQKTVKSKNKKAVASASSENDNLLQETHSENIQPTHQLKSKVIPSFWLSYYLYRDAENEFARQSLPITETVDKKETDKAPQLLESKPQYDYGSSVSKSPDTDITSSTSGDIASAKENTVAREDLSSSKQTVTPLLDEKLAWENYHLTRNAEIAFNALKTTAITKDNPKILEQKAVAATFEQCEEPEVPQVRVVDAFWYNYSSCHDAERNWHVSRATSNQISPAAVDLDLHRKREIDTSTIPKMTYADKLTSGARSNVEPVTDEKQIETARTPNIEALDVLESGQDTQKQEMPWKAEFWLNQVQDLEKCGVPNAEATIKGENTIPEKVEHVSMAVTPDSHETVLEEFSPTQKEFWERHPNTADFKENETIKVESVSVEQKRECLAVEQKAILGAPHDAVLLKKGETHLQTELGKEIAITEGEKEVEKSSPFKAAFWENYSSCRDAELRASLSSSSKESEPTHQQIEQAITEEIAPPIEVKIPTPSVETLEKLTLPAEIAPLERTKACKIQFWEDYHLCRDAELEYNIPNKSETKEEKESVSSPQEPPVSSNLLEKTGKTEKTAAESVSRSTEAAKAAAPCESVAEINPQVSAKTTAQRLDLFAGTFDYDLIALESAEREYEERKSGAKISVDYKQAPAEKKVEQQSQIPSAAVEELDERIKTASVPESLSEREAPSPGKEKRLSNSQEIENLFDELASLVSKYEHDVKNLPKEELKLSINSLEGLLDEFMRWERKVNDVLADINSHDPEEAPEDLANLQETVLALLSSAAQGKNALLEMLAAASRKSPAESVEVQPTEQVMPVETETKVAEPKVKEITVQAVLQEKSEHSTPEIPMAEEASVSEISSEPPSLAETTSPEISIHMSTDADAQVHLEVAVVEETARTDSKGKSKRKKKGKKGKEDKQEASTSNAFASVPQELAEKDEKESATEKLPFKLESGFTPPPEVQSVDTTPCQETVTVTQDTQPLESVSLEEMDEFVQQAATTLTTEPSEILKTATKTTILTQNTQVSTVTRSVFTGDKPVSEPEVCQVVSHTSVVGEEERLQTDADGKTEVRVRQKIMTSTSAPEQLQGNSSVVIQEISDAPLELANLAESYEPTSVSSIRTVLQQTSRRIIKRVKRIIRKRVIIDGIVQEIEEVIEEPEETELVESSVPQLSIQYTEEQLASGERKVDTSPEQQEVSTQDETVDSSLARSVSVPLSEDTEKSSLEITPQDSEEQHSSSTGAVPKIQRKKRKGRKGKEKTPSESQPTSKVSTDIIEEDTTPNTPVDLELDKSESEQPSTVAESLEISTQERKEESKAPSVRIKISDGSPKVELEICTNLLQDQASTESDVQIKCSIEEEEQTSSVTHTEELEPAQSKSKKGKKGKGKVLVKSITSSVTISNGNTDNAEKPKAVVEVVQTQKGSKGKKSKQQKQKQEKAKSPTGEGAVSPSEDSKSESTAYEIHVQTTVTEETFQISRPESSVEITEIVEETVSAPEESAPVKVTLAENLSQPVVLEITDITDPLQMSFASVPVVSTPVYVSPADLIPTESEVSLQEVEELLEAAEASKQVAKVPVQAAEVPVQVAEEPVLLAEVPVHAAKEPMQTAEKAVLVPEVQVQAAEESAKTAELPVHAAEQPMQAAEKPLQVAEEPLLVAEVPVHAAKEPMQTAEKPVLVPELQVQAAEESAKTAELPVHAAEQPMQAAEKPLQAAKEPVLVPEVHVQAAEESAKTAELSVHAAEKPVPTLETEVRIQPTEAATLEAKTQMSNVIAKCAYKKLLPKESCARRRSSLILELPETSTEDCRSIVAENLSHLELGENREIRIVTILTTVSTWLEVIEYQLHTIQELGDSADKNSALATIKQNSDEIRTALATLHQSGYLEDDSQGILIDQIEIKKCLDSVTEHLCVVEDLTQESESDLENFNTSWMELLTCIEQAKSRYAEVESNMQALQSIIASDELLAHIENAQRENHALSQGCKKIIQRGRLLMKRYPQLIIPLDIYEVAENSRNLGHKLGAEKDKAIQKIAITDEYKRTIDELAQIIEVAQVLVESPLVVNDREQLQEEMQKHRKFFANLSHCQQLLESLDMKLDEESRGSHAELHKNLHCKASLILDNAACKAQRMALAASRWTFLEQGLREENEWLKVALQRVPELDSVNSTDVPKFITQYQALAADISAHNCRIIELTSVAHSLQDLVTCGGLEASYNEQADAVGKLQDNVQKNLHKLTAFKQNWNRYEDLSEKIEAWARETESTLKNLSHQNMNNANTRQFWELKAQYEVFTLAKNEAAAQMNQAFVSLHVADEMLQRQFQGQLEDRWQVIGEKITAIQSKMRQNLSIENSVLDKIHLMETELKDVHTSMNEITQKIQTEEDILLYIQRLQILLQRCEIMEEELSALGPASPAQLEEVSRLINSSRRLGLQLGEEKEMALTLREKFSALVKGLAQSAHMQELIGKKLDGCEEKEKQTSGAVDQALHDCMLIESDLALQWQKLMQLRQALHSLPLSLRASVSPVGVEREMSSLQSSHLQLEDRLKDVHSRLRGKQHEWRAFDRKLESVQQSVQETDYMMDLLTIKGGLDYEQLKVATERLERLVGSLGPREELLSELQCAAVPLASSSAPEVRQRVEESVASAVSAWHLTSGKVRSLCSRYQDAVHLWQRYLDASDALRTWSHQHEDLPEDADDLKALATLAKKLYLIS
ncbi:titin-like [Cloeon dipterum]|uniref:titin-like n=1 Tax=Cloeon dipterum TaxID=197152 RepID=UPI00321FAC98